MAAAETASEGHAPRPPLLVGEDASTDEEDERKHRKQDSGHTPPHDSAKQSPRLCPSAPVRLPRSGRGPGTRDTRPSACSHVLR